MKYCQQQHNAFPNDYLNNLWGEIRACPYFAVNNLNGDFVGTKGFSLVFKRSHISVVEQKFPYFKLYLDLALQASCNAFYLNPLQLKEGSRVDPHIDRSLRSYCKTVAPPLFVSVLYVRLPEDMQGGELVLKSEKRQLGQIKPQINTLLCFQGDLIHSVNTVKTSGHRLSLVCEQYSLSKGELVEIPEFTVESRTKTTNRTKKYAS
ncbi:2OG-Fe(II) oxygenase [Umezakia ovalisporum]|uniref:2OG-Fe(II) oxygenase n=2 Tax=Umezakia ovalisporum TaxID=75695 RepID=A0AA43KEQ4_9CYAN|nr:2OG-Fe(II) oxygenase [Umezakia ovalisporum]MDH6058784.1 2OG-Fe(II) oxygenase [Umezakia ovalisporum FSS-43]MDH6063238.1 2OG-Fe(II) oxygenase [Umezakia ovalisporum FSS-62]MDH6068315.1 2OG-Fe(II) oxygenase [Umezakia ovalisporum APH033B]MDH6069574.1 2OG-Fe(II) oxygenase [Umezakia ovalisporum CobakiLakeA]MDH6075303.1 2OG-Fe(II) oxygenase [Umezakia ovalisporum CS-1034]